MNELSGADPHLLAQRLTQARKRRGMTQDDVAARLGISRPTLIAMEKGTRRAKAEEIIQLADLYGRSVNELVRPDAPSVELHPHLRAVLGPAPAGAAELDAAIDELERLAADYRSLEQMNGVALPAAYPAEIPLPPRGSVEQWAEDAAARERTRLGLGDQPIFNLRDLLEAEVGLRIFYWPLPAAVAGLYAFTAESGPCIMVNRKHPPTRRRATIAHEYGHFMTERFKPGVAYIDGHMRKPRTERFVEAFAMALLMPAAALRRRLAQIVQRSGDFQVADLCRLAHEFHTSLQAMTWRLEEIGLIPAGAYDDLIERGFKVAEAQRELGLEPTTDPDSTVPQRYTLLALQAFDNEQITEGQLARLLRVDRVDARRIVAESIERLNRAGDLPPDYSLLRRKA